MNYYTAPLQFFDRHFFLCETTYSVVFYTFLEIIMRQFPYKFTFSTVAHNPFCSSQPSMVHWLSSSIFPCSVVCSFGWLSRYGNTRPNLTSSCPTPPKPIHFQKAYDNSYSNIAKGTTDPGVDCFVQ